MTHITTSPDERDTFSDFEANSGVRGRRTSCKLELLARCLEKRCRGLRSFACYCAFLRCKMLTNRMSHCCIWLSHLATGAGSSRTSNLPILILVARTRCQGKGKRRGTRGSKDQKASSASAGCGLHMSMWQPSCIFQYYTHGEVYVDSGYR